MAQLGLFAKLNFKGDQAVQGMRSATKAFGGMRQAAAGFKQAAGGIKQVMGNLTIAATAITGIAGVMLKKTASFQSQMATVTGLVRLNADISGKSRADAERDLVALSNKAKELGATTRFTATQAAEGIEVMTRAGFGVKDVLSGLPGILQAAAAEDMNLADATGVVAGVLRQFNMDASKATKVADILAATSAATNTNILELGEAMRYGGLQAANMGISVQDTAAMMGLLANSTLKASVGGTSLTNMLLGFVKGVKGPGGARKTLEKWGVQLKDSGGKLRAVGDIFKDLTKTLSSQQGTLIQTAELQTVFGRRGVKAAQALISAQTKAEKQFGATADAIGDLSKRVDRNGAAATLAEAKLDSLTGQITILGSAFEGLSIEVMTPFLAGMSGGTKAFSESLQNAANALRFMSTDAKSRTKEMVADFAKLPEGAKEFATGVNEGIDSVKAGFQSLKQTMKGTMEFLGFGTSARDMGKLIVQIGAIAPALLAAAAALKVVSMGFGAVSGAARTMVGVTRIGAGGVRQVARAGRGIFRGLRRFGGGRIVGAIGGAAEAAAGIQGTPVYVTNVAEFGGAVGTGVEGALSGRAAGAGGAAGLGAAGSKAAAAAGLGLGSKIALAAGPLAVLAGGLALFIKASSESINLIGDYEALAKRSPLRAIIAEERKLLKEREETQRRIAQQRAAETRREFGGEVDVEAVQVAKQLGGRFAAKARDKLLKQAQELAMAGETTKVSRVLQLAGIKKFTVGQTKAGIETLELAKPQEKQFQRLKGMLDSNRMITDAQLKQLAELENLRETLDTLSKMIGLQQSQEKFQAEITVNLDGQQVAKALVKNDVKDLKGRGQRLGSEQQRLMEFTGSREVKAAK